MKERLFGTMPDGTPVTEWTLSNHHFTVEILSYGGRIKRLVAFGTDVVCGFDTLEEYLRDVSYQGALVGRVANRISGGRLHVEGKDYQLALNAGDGTVHLHGGEVGYSHRVWECTDVGPDHLSLHLVSPDGEENYPACLTLDVTYTLTDEGLGMEYRATSDGTTPVNLTNHAYFNLAGCRGESILPYLAWINADYYTALNELLLPVADLPVDGTSFDFRQKRPIGTPMEAGYDNNFRLLHTVTEEVGGKTLPLVATVENGALRFKLYTDQPCMQFYIGNALCDPLPFRGGVEQIPHTTFCMEAQIRPDSPTHGEGFLHAGEVYTQSTFYAFERL